MEHGFKTSDFENKEQNEKIKKKIFVEIGTSMGSIPFLKASQGREMDSDEQYIGVDIDEMAIEGNQAVFGNDNVTFKREDAEQMESFADASVDTVFIGNVFGCSLTDDARINILHSASRILKVGGKMIIKETNTPFSEAKIEKMLNDVDMSYRSVKPEQVTEWDKLIQDYHGSYPPSANPYFIIAHKK